MHEYIDLQFFRRGKPFDVARQVAGGVEFDEPDPLTRVVSLGFLPGDAITAYRVARIAQLRGWPPGQFTLRVSVEDGSLVLRGDDEHALPEGRYRVTADVSGMRVRKIPASVVVVHDGHADVRIEVETDDRTIDVDLSGLDAAIDRVVAASSIDGVPAGAWLEDDDVRPARRACLLNVLAMLRVMPLPSQPLIADVTRFFVARDDRGYAVATPSLHATLETLADRNDRPVYREGRPHAAIHEQLLAAAWDAEPETTTIFTAPSLLSYRAEGRPSLQVVLARPDARLDHTFADVDLDLGNPLQDLAGLFVHFGEVLRGKMTSHLDLRQKLSTSPAGDYLYYRVAA